MTKTIIRRNVMIKNKHNTVIILTKLFPYNHSEAFLESEVPYLQEKFSNIIFMPLLKGKIRSNFTNSVINDSYNELYHNKFFFIIKTLFSISLYNALLTHKKKFFNKNTLIACFKQQVHKLIIQAIIKNNPSLFTEETIIYSYWFNAPVYAFLSLKTEYDLKFKVVCRAHRWDVYDEKGEMPYRQFCISKIDRIFPISQDSCNYFERKYGHRDKYILSRLGVVDRNCISKKSTKPHLQILTISQLIKRKRIDLTLQAITKLASKRNDIIIEWTHFGTGEMKEELEKQVELIHFPNLRINFMGYIPNAEIIEYLHVSEVDAFINLSSSEGVPVSIMEAQSFGIPVIATDVGGTSEIVNDQNGILLQASPSIDEVLNALEYIYNNDFDREIIKSNWSKLSNAQTNFTLFATQLLSL